MISGSQSLNHQITKSLNLIFFSTCLTFLTIQSTWAAGAAVTLTTADVTTSIQKGAHGAGASDQPVWRLMFTVPSGTIVGVNLTLVHVRHIGSLPHAQVTKVALYRSFSPTFGASASSLASGTLDANGDVTLKGFTMNVWGFEDIGMIYFDRYAFLVIDVSGAASTSDTIRLSLLDKTWVKFGGSDNVQATGTFPQTSGPIYLFDNTLDSVTVTSGAALTTIQRGGQEAVLALTLATTGSTVLNQVKFSLTNDPADVASVKLYRESGEAGWQTTDTPVGSPVTTFGVNRLGTFSGLTEMFAGAGAVFYLAVSLKPDAALGQTFSLTLPNNEYLSVGNPDTVNAFAAGCGNLLVGDPTPVMTMTAGVVAPPWLTQGEGTGNTPYERAAFLRLTLVTDQGEAVWGGLRASLIGSLSLTNRGGYPNLRVYLARDDNPANGTWETSDTTLRAVTHQASFLFGNNDLTFRGFAETITTSPKVYFIVAGVDEAPVGQSLGLVVNGPQEISLTSGIVAAGTFPLSTGVSTTIADRPEWLDFDFSPPASPLGLYPGVERWYFHWNIDVIPSHGGDETVVWNSLRLSLSGNQPLSNVAEVRLYRYTQQTPPPFPPVLLASLSSFGADRWITLSNVNLTLTAYDSSITDPLRARNFLVTVRPKATANSFNLSLGVGLVNYEDVQLAPPDNLLLGEYNYFAPAVLLSPLLYVTMTSVSQSPISMTQRQSASLMRVSLYAPVGTNLNLSSVRITVAAPGGVNMDLKVYSQYQAGSETMQGNETLRGQVLVNGPGTVELVLNNGNLSGLGPDVPFHLFFVAALRPDSPSGNTVSLQFGGVENFFVNLGVTLVSSGGSWNTGTVTVVETPDILTLSVKDDTPISPYVEVRVGALRWNTPRALLQISLENVSGDHVTMPALKVSLLGNIPADTVRLKIFKGDTASSTWVNDAPFLGPLVWGADRTVTFTPPLFITHQPSGARKPYLFLAVETNFDAIPGATVGLSLFTGGSFAPTLAFPDTIVIRGTGDSRIVTLMPYDADVVELHGTDSGLPSEIDSNGLSPIVNLTAWTTAVGGEGRAQWRGLTVSFWAEENTTVDFRRARVVLYRDTNTNGSWDSVDSVVASGTGGVSGTMALLTLSGMNETLTSLPRGYFLALSLTLMEVGKEFGVAPIGWSLDAPDVAAPVMAPDLSTVLVTPLDTVTMSVHYSAPSILTQREGGTFFRLTLTTTGESRLSQLQLSLIQPPVGVTGTAFLYLDDGSGVYEGDLVDNLRASSSFNWNSGPRLTLTFLSQDALEPIQTYLLRLTLLKAPSEHGYLGVAVTSPDDLTVMLPDRVAMNAPTSSGAGLTARVEDIGDQAIVSDVISATSGFPGFRRPLAPMSILRFILDMSGGNTSEWAVLTQLKFTLGGNLFQNPAWVKSVTLYRDEVPLGGWQPDKDSSLAVVTNFTSPEATFTNLSVTITSDWKGYYLVLDPSISAPVNTTFGVGVLNATWFTLAGADTLTSIGAMNIATVLRLSDTAKVVLSQSPVSDDIVRQGQPVALIGISLFTSDVATLTAVRCSLVAIPSHVASIQLYQDTAVPMRVWTPDDAILATVTTFGNGWATLDGLAVPFSSNNFFLVLTPALTAPPDATVKLSLPGNTSVDITGVDAVIPYFDWWSASPTILPANADIVRAKWWDFGPGQAYPQFPTPRLGMTLSTDRYDARLTALQVSFGGTVNDLVHLTALLYRGSSLIQSTPFGADRNVTFTGLSETLIGSGSEYLIGVEAGPGANGGALLNLHVLNLSFLIVESPDRVTRTFDSGGSSSVMLIANPSVTLTAGAANATAQFSLGVSKDFLRLVIGTELGTTAITHVALSLYGTATEVPDFQNRFAWPYPVTFGSGSMVHLAVSLMANFNPRVYNIALSLIDTLENQVLLMGKTIGVALPGVESARALPPYLVVAGATPLPVSSGLATIVKKQGLVASYWDWAPGFGGAVRSGNQTVVRLSLNNPLNTSAPPQAPAALQAMSLSLNAGGAWNPTEIAAVLFKDTNGDGTWQTGDESLTSSHFGPTGLIVLAGPGWPITLPSAPDHFFVAIRPLGNGPTGASAVLSVQGNHLWATYVPPDIVHTYPNNSLTLALISPDADLVSGAVAPVSSNLIWTAGVEAPWLRMTLVSDGGSPDHTAQLTALVVSLAPGTIRSFIKLTLYEDRGEAGWQTTDTRLAGLTLFDSQGIGTFRAFTSTVGPAGLTYFIAGRVSPNAPAGASTGVIVLTDRAKVAAPDEWASFTHLQVYPIPQTYSVTLAGRSTHPSDLAPGTEVTMLALSLNTNGGEAVFNRLSLSLEGTLRSTEAVWKMFAPERVVTWFDGSRLTLTAETLIGVASDPPDPQVVTFTPMSLTLFSTLNWMLVNGVAQMQPRDFLVTLSLAPSVASLTTIGTRLVQAMDPVGVNPPGLVPLPALLPQWSVVYVNPVVAGEIIVGGRLAATTSITQGAPGYRATLLTLSMASTNGALKVRQMSFSLLGSDEVNFGTWWLGEWAGVTEAYRLVTFRGAYSTTLSYPLQFEPSVSIPVETPIGVTLLSDPAWVVVDSPGIVLPFNGIGTSLFAIRDYPDDLAGGGRDVAPVRIRPGEVLPFLELTLTASQEETVWTRMGLNLAGTLNPSLSLVEARLYRDDPPDGTWNLTDAFLGSGTYHPATGQISLGGWADTLTASSPRRYFVALSLTPGAASQAGKTIGIPGGYLFSEGVGLEVTPSGLARVLAGNVFVEGGDLAPPGAPPGGSAALFQLSLRTAPGVTATLTSLTLQLRGDLDPDRFSIYFVRDEAPANGQWEAGETRLGTLTGRGAYDSSRRGAFTGLQVSLSETPSAYFLVLTLDGSAPEYSTVGVSLMNPLAVLAPSTAEAFTGGSRLVRVDGPDVLNVAAVALEASQLIQGVTFPFIRVTLTANQDQVQLQSLRLSLTGNLPPAFAQARLMNSIANFGADRWATLTALTLPVATIPLVYDVQLSVSSVAPIGRIVGLALPGGEAWGVDAPDTVVMTPSALSSPLGSVVDRPDTLTLTAADLSPPFAILGAEQAFMRMTLRVAEDELNLRALEVELVGTVPSSLVTARLYRDANHTAGWEVGEDSLMALGSFSPDGKTTLVMAGEMIGAANPVYFVTLSLQDSAAMGLTLGVRMTNAAPNATVDPPDGVWFGRVWLSVPQIWFYSGGTSALREVKRPELLALSSEVLAPPVLLAGTQVSLLQLGLEPTQGSFATWTSLRLSVTGTLPPDDLLFELSRADGTLMKALRIGTSRTGVFAGLQEFVNEPQQYLLTVTHTGATLHRTFGVTLKSSDFVFGDGGFPVAGFKTGVSSVFVKQPAEVRLTVQSWSPLTITQGASPQALWTLTLQTDQDLAVARAVVLSLGPVPTAPGLAVRLYRETLSPDTWTESDESLTGAEASTGPWLTLSGFTHTLTSTPTRYHIVVAPAVHSAVGLVQFTLASAWGQWEWAQSVRGSGGDGALTVSDAPDRVTLFAADTGPATHRQNAERAYLALTLTVDQDSLLLTTLRVALSPEGTLDPTLVGPLHWYVDNGDGGWDPGQDALLASASWANGLAALAPSLTVLGGRVITFLTVPLSPGVPAGRTLGLSLLSDPLTVLAPDTVTSFTGFASALKTVVVGVPLTLTVSSSDPGTSVLQGTTRFTLLNLTLSNGSAIGDFTAVEGLTFHVSPSSDLLVLWVEAEGVTLGASSDTGATRQLSLAAQIAGTPSWQVLGAVAPLALPGTLRITLTGVGVGLPDVVSLESLGAVGTALIADAPDTVTVTGVPRTATRLVRGASFTSLLTVTAQVSSLPHDSARLQALMVSLTGRPPVGGSPSAFQDAFTVGLFSPTGETLLTSASFIQRVATLTVSTPLMGETTAAWTMALSLAANAPLPDVYGGVAGLTLVAVGLDGVDVSQLTASLAHPPVVLFDQKIHVRRGLGEAAVTAITLGTTQVLAQLTLMTDRDTLRLRAVVLTLNDLFGNLGESDVTGWQWYRETGTLEGWQSGEDLNLGAGSWVGGNQISLWAGTGITLTTVSTSLWIIGRLNPFFNTFGNYLTLSVSERYDQPVAITPPILTSPGYHGVDAAATLRVGATALLPSVVLTGETVSAFKLSLQAVGGGVGVTLVGLEVNALEAVSLAPYLTYQLMEGSRLLSTGGIKATLATVLQVTFGLREPIYDTPVYWELLLTIAPETPSQRFNVTFHPLQTQLAGGEDVVLGSAVTTVTTEVIASWGASRLQVLGATSPLPSGGSLAARGAVIPVARLVVKTAEAGMRAKLALLRARRLGQGRDDDVKLAVYRSPATLLTFDPGAAVRLGRGAVMHRLATVPLTVRPFFTFEEPMALWLVAEIQPEALIGATWGLEVDAPGFVGQGLVDVQGADLPFRTPWLTLWDTTPSSLAITWAGSSGSLVTQGTRITLGGFTTQLEAGPGSVITGVRLTTTGPLPGLQVLNAAGENGVRGLRAQSGLLTVTLTLPVTATAQHYPLVMSLPPTALVGTTLQITVGPEDVLGPTLDTRTGNGGSAWTSGAFVVTDAPDTLTLSARPRPVPWEVSDWTPAFLITLSVNQDEASLIRITLLRFGDLMIDDLVIATFRWRISNMVVPVVAQSLGSGLIGLSFNHQITRSPDPQMGTLELSLAPSINLTGTLGLSLLGVGLAPDPVTGLVADTVVFTPVGTSLLGIRNPAQPFPPSLVVNARYVKGLGAFGATWGATVKHGTISSYRYVVLSWKGVSPDFDTLALSLIPDPLALPAGWEALTPWTVTDQPRLLETTLQLAHGMTLYVAVQAKTATGPWSEVAYSDAIVVDGMKPQFSPRAPDAIKGKKQMVLSWNAPAMGPSGVERYVVERRRGTKPTWEVLISAQAPRLDLPASSGSEEWSLWYPALLEVRGKRYEENSKEVSGNNRSAPALQLPNYQINKLINAPIETKLTPYLTSTSSVLPLEDGTSYYRVKAVSGAGEESEPTATTKVVSGLENLPHLLNEVSNYPNPFDSRVKSTTLVYVLNQDAKVTVHLLTVLGERLHEWTFDAGAPGGQAGANEVTWDGANVLGQKVTTGAYLAVVRATGGDGKTEQVVRKVGVKH